VPVMNSPMSDPLAEGLCYEASLPFSIQVLESAPDAEHLAYWNEYNEAALRSMAALDEYTNQLPEEHANQGHELARLEFKVNLVLDLVGQLLAQQMLLPEAVWLKVGAHGVQWSSPEAPAVGEPLLLQIYLTPTYPRPLELPATVVKLETLTVGARCTAAFKGCSEPVQDWLEKLIFRHHRRRVAHARAPRAGD
jgi:hypothetical protein